ncbi:MAG: hypothetical protein KDB13_14935, partial [Microthrixaceae bacterium]|nr:hypothetical protein [Microthrixaceae bacterium]
MLLADPAALSKFAEHEVVVPLVVLTELEDKRAHPELGWSARESLRRLEDLRIEHSTLTEPIPVNEAGGTVRVELNNVDTSSLPMAFANDTNDHRILAVARNLADKGLDVVLVSKDLPLRLKAAVVDLDADEYRHELSELEGWTGIVQAQVASTVTESLYRDRTCPLPEGLDVPLNTGLTLRSPGGSALARLRADGRLHLVDGDRPVFDLRGRSAEQRVALDLLSDPTVGIVSLGGPAGTGKSVLAL